MSLNHPGEYEYQKGGVIVLTKNDRYKIRTGKILLFTFHAMQFKNRTMSFLVANKDSIPKVDSKLAKAYLSLGDVCPITIDKEEMKTLQDKTKVLARALPCEPEYLIQVCTSEQWHERVMEKNKNEKNDI